MTKPHCFIFLLFNAKMQKFDVVSFAVFCYVFTRSPVLTANGLPQTGNATQDLLEHFFGDELANLNHFLKPPVQVIVNISLSLNRIIDLNEATQELTVIVTCGLYWYNNQLQWAPSNFGNVTSVTIPASFTWIPDIALWNNVDDRYRQRLQTETLTILYTGNIIFFRPSLFKVLCTAYNYLYPFDYTQCKLSFGSWTYPQKDVDIYPRTGTEALTNDYSENSIWTLNDFYSVKEIINYHESVDGEHPNFSIMNYYIVLYRHFLLPFIYIVFPNLILNTFALFTHVLPCESTEKIGLGINAFLGTVIYMSLLNRVFPKTSDIPILISFILANMFLITAGIIINIGIIQIHSRGSQRRRTKLPRWARRLLLHKIAKLLFMENKIVPDEEYMERITQTVEDFTVEEDPTNPAAIKKLIGDTVSKQQTFQHGSKQQTFQQVGQRKRSVWIQEDSLGIAPPVKIKHSTGHRRSVLGHKTFKEKEELVMYKTLKHMETVAVKQAEAIRFEEIQMEWKQAAMVIDRLFFVIYLIISAGFWIVYIVFYIQRSYAAEDIHVN